MRRWALAATVLAAAAAVAVLALVRWQEHRYARGAAVRIAQSTAAYFTVVTPPARADSSDLDLVQLLAQARALTTLPGWASPVEVFHGTAPLVDAAAPPLPATELESSAARWRDGAALVPLRGPSPEGDGAVVGVVAVRPIRRAGVLGLLLGWAAPAALLSIAAAAAVSLRRRPRWEFVAAAALLGLAAYADVRAAARRNTDSWLAATRLLVREAATRLPGPRIRAARADLAPVTLGAELVDADSATQEPRRKNVRGERRAVVAVRLGSGRWVEVRTSPAESATGVWLIVLLGVALAGPLGLAALDWTERAAARPRLLRETATAWAFVAPAGLHLAVFTIGPLLLALHLAVPPPVSHGLANVQAVARDPQLWVSLRNTALYALYVPVSMALALAVALVLSRPGRVAVVLRTAFLLPYMSSVVAMALLWQSLAGVGPRDWLASEGTALPVVMLLSLWVQLGCQLMVWIAGLQRIPPAYLDAARVDGANAWQCFWRVTFPLLRPVMVFVLVTGVIGAFQTFTYVHVLTGGGPLGATELVAQRIYQTGWQSLQFGRASALSLVVFLLLAGVVWLQFKVLRGESEVEHV